MVGPLVTVENLQKLMTERRLQIIDIRGASGRSALFSYAAGHIPGSVNVPYGTWRAVWSDPMALPSDAALTGIVRGAGLRKRGPVVIVHSGAAKGNFGSAAFVYWMLKSSGFTNLAILDGGIRAWKAADGPISQEATAIAPSDETVIFSRQWLATHEDVDAVLDGKSDAQLVDSRPVGKGALEGSLRLDHAEMLNGENGQAGDVLTAFMRLKDSLLDWESRDVITYCNNGALAATNWFMASEISGIENVKIYGHSLKAREKRQDKLNF